MDKEVKDLAKQIMQNAPKQSPHRNVKTEGQLIFGPYVPLCKVHDGLINGLLKICIIIELASVPPEVKII